MDRAGLITSVEFDVAHFRVHITMKGRSTYIIPLPSTVVGFFFSIMGLNRELFIKNRTRFYAGAQLDSLESMGRENVQLLKLKQTKLSSSLSRSKNISKIKEKITTRTTEEMMVLFRPKYKFALWGDLDFIDKLNKKIENFEFEFIPYGGISEFIFWDIHSSKVVENFQFRDEILNSYAPLEIVKMPILSEKGEIYSYPYLQEGILKKVIMAYHTSLSLLHKIPTLEGIPIYKIPLEVINL